MQSSYEDVDNRGICARALYDYQAGKFSRERTHLKQGVGLHQCSLASNVDVTKEFEWVV